MRARGFTLIELMIVVAMIGILAAIAIPSFQNYQLTSKRSEAFANLSGLSKSQRSYFAEYGVFVAVASEPFGTTGVLPNANKRTWAGVMTFDQVGWAPEGDVFFDYDTNALGGGFPCACTDGCFTAAAYGDLDANGMFSALLYVHPGNMGGLCNSALFGFGVPIDPGTLNPLFDTAARSFAADTF